MEMEGKARWNHHPATEEAWGFMRLVTRTIYDGPRLLFLCPAGFCRPIQKEADLSRTADGQLVSSFAHCTFGRRSHHEGAKGAPLSLSGSRYGREGQVPYDCHYTT